MFKRKRIDEPPYKNLIIINELMDDIYELRKRVNQLECPHDYKFDHYDYIMSKRVFHKCPMCSKEVSKEWCHIARKGQQALKLLNLVPKDWIIKGTKND